MLSFSGPASIGSAFVRVTDGSGSAQYINSSMNLAPVFASGSTASIWVVGGTTTTRFQLIYEMLTYSGTLGWV
jgi:hypothetical protein